MHDDIDDATVFGVHADECAVLCCLTEGFEDGGIVNHEHAWISHEEFETGDTFIDHGVHVFESSFAEIGDDHVEAVIDGGFLIGLFPPGIERVAHLGALGLDGEIDESGGASEGGDFGAGFEIVGGRGAAEGHIEVSVNVDAARDQQHTCCIDDLVGIGSRNGVGDVFDGFVLDQKI